MWMDDYKSADDLLYAFKIASWAAVEGNTEAQEIITYMLEHNLVDTGLREEVEEKCQLAHELVQPGAICSEGRFCLISLQPKKPDGGTYFFS